MNVCFKIQGAISNWLDHSCDGVADVLERADVPMIDVTVFKQTQSGSHSKGGTSSECSSIQFICYSLISSLTKANY